MTIRAARPRLAIAAVVGTALGATLAVGTLPASAAVSDGYASGSGSFRNDWCAGHAWLRVLGDSWGTWKHGSTGKTLTSPNGKFRKAQHKGCADCTVYTTEVK